MWTPHYYIIATIISSLPLHHPLPLHHRHTDNKLVTPEMKSIARRRTDNYGGSYSPPISGGATCTTTAANGSPYTDAYAIVNSSLDQYAPTTSAVLEAASGLDHMEEEGGEELVNTSNNAAGYDPSDSTLHRYNADTDVALQDLRDITTSPYQQDLLASYFENASPIKACDERLPLMYGTMNTRACVEIVRVFIIDCTRVYNSLYACIIACTRVYSSLYACR